MATRAAGQSSLNIIIIKEIFEIWQGNRITRDWHTGEQLGALRSESPGSSEGLKQTLQHTFTQAGLRAWRAVLPTVLLNLAVI